MGRKIKRLDARSDKVHWKTRDDVAHRKPRDGLSRRKANAADMVAEPCIMIGTVDPVVVHTFKSLRVSTRAAKVSVHSVVPGDDGTAHALGAKRLTRDVIRRHGSL